MFAVQGWKKVHFCQSVLFYFSREKCLVSDQTNCIHTRLTMPKQSTFLQSDIPSQSRWIREGRGADWATSSRFGNTRSQTIRFSSKIIFSHSRFSDLPTALHLSCRHFCLQTLTCRGVIFFEVAFLLSKWLLQIIFSSFAIFQIPIS